MSEQRTAVDSSIDALRSTGVGGPAGLGANRGGIQVSYMDTASPSRALARAIRWAWAKLAHRAH